jgi:hypothetical protein
MAKHTPQPATRAIADVTSKPPFRYEPGPDGGFYLCRPPNYAAASVAVQSRWGNLYDAPAAVRSLAVDVGRQAQVIAEVAIPADGPVADRLPGQSLRLRALGLPTPPFRGRFRLTLSLGEVTDLVMAHVDLAPGLDPAGDGMHVVITAAVGGEVFGLARAQAGRPPNVVKQAARTIRLLVGATAAAAGPETSG